MTSIASGIKLKSGLIDYYIFFLVFLFGVQTVEDGMKVIKWILLGAVFANLATILDAAGIINLGYTERLDGRTQGAIGESNQYAAYIILFIPGLIAAAVGVARLHAARVAGRRADLVRGAGHDRLARRLRRHRSSRAPSAPIYTATSSPTAASPAGCSARSWCSCSS